jgi:hypothetical protein
MACLLDSPVVIFPLVCGDKRRRARCSGARHLARALARLRQGEHTPHDEIGPVRRQLFTFGRIGFGLLYLAAAIANVVMAFTDPEIYSTFTDETYIGFYDTLWTKYVDPHLAAWIVALSAVEFVLAGLLLTRRAHVRVGLAGGIVFTALLAPSNPWTRLNLILVVAQMLLFAYDLRARHGNMAARL